jgi:16S rRNA processing protein RimM
MQALPGTEPAALPADAIEVGRVLDAWGVKGWLKILPYSADPEALFSSRRWFLQPAERGVPTFEGVVRVAVQEAKPHADGVVACLREVADRTVAESFRGARIFVPRTSFPTPAADEFYWVDLIGLAVLNQQGLALGQVIDLMATGAQTVLVLQAEQDGKPLERLIPFVSAFVLDVDLTAKRILVDWQPDY